MFWKIITLKKIILTTCPHLTTKEHERHDNIHAVNITAIWTEVGYPPTDIFFSDSDDNYSTHGHVDVIVKHRYAHSRLNLVLKNNGQRISHKTARSNLRNLSPNSNPIDSNWIGTLSN